VSCNEDYAQRLALAAEYHAFLTRMKTDGLVVTVAEDRLGWVSSAESRSTQTTKPPGCAGWWPGRRRRYRRGTAVGDGGRARPAKHCGGRHRRAGCAESTSRPPDVDDQQVPEVPLGHGMPQPPQITEALADATCMPRSALQEIVDLLQSQQQIVLYGPPGTGKTYLAKKPS
jgi:5-methylcytosine-specific restriction enzyme B